MYNRFASQEKQILGYFCGKNEMLDLLSLLDVKSENQQSQPDSSCWIYEGQQV